MKYNNVNLWLSANRQWAWQASPDAYYREGSVISSYLPLLRQYLTALELAAKSGPVLDLACGHGRNGLYLTEREIPVVFADISPTALDHVQTILHEKPARADKGTASLWPVDLEQPGINPFSDRIFGGIVAFNYLHRPLFEQLKHAVHPGGIVLYETFTIDQANHGRPKNPAFLLRPGELLQTFSDWDILHYYEGVVENKAGTGSKAIAQLAAQKPVS